MSNIRDKLFPKHSQCQKRRNASQARDKHVKLPLCIGAALSRRTTKAFRSNIYIHGVFSHIFMKNIRANHFHEKILSISNKLWHPLCCYML